MPRIALIASTAFAALACALLPSGALAHGHHRGHHHARHARHHGRRSHAFGAHNSVGPQQTASGTTGSSAPTENVGPTPGSPEGNAGTIVSFTEGVLTIKLGEGEKATTISGKVDEDTEIHCIPAPATTPPGSAPTSSTAHVADNGGWGDGQRGQQSGGEPGMNHDDDQGSGDDRDGGDRNLEGGEHCRCATTNLTPGTIVHRAELQLDASGAVFREIVLVG